MQNFTIRLTLTVLAVFVLNLSPHAEASPGFDLDLKELKKPSTPPAVTKKTPVTKTAVKKQTTSVTQPAAQPKKSVSAPKPVPVTQATPVVVSAPVAPSELTLVGRTPCQLAERMAVAVARAVPAEQLLFGLNLKTIASVQYNSLSVLISCNIAPAEAYTYSRLLEAHQVQLVNIRESETIGQVARSIVDALALSYQLEKTISVKDKGESLIYLFPQDRERQRPLRLILQPY